MDNLRHDLDDLRFESHRHHTPFSFLTVASADEFVNNARLAAMTADHPKDLVLVFVDTMYLQTFGVWLNYYKQHDNSGRILCVFAATEHAYEKLGDVFVSPTAQDNFGNVSETLLVNLNLGKDVKAVNLKGLWVERIQLLRRIVNAFPSLNVLCTDADAIWLQDPAQLYNHPQHISSNIVTSKGTYPGKCPLGREDDGDAATICFGFTYYRNSAALRTLTLDMVNEIPKYKNDDQFAINCVLYNLWVSNDTINIDNKSSMADFKLDDG